LTNALFSDDSHYFAAALQQLGFSVELDPARQSMIVHGLGGRIPAKKAELLKTLGREVKGEGSWRAGLEVEQEFLRDVVGIDPAAFHLRDASGLSTGNLITPAALNRLVRYLATSPRARPALDALPVNAGATGSLRNRLTDLPGRVRAKTGSVRNVASLSGLVRTDSGAELAFAILANGTGLPGSRLTAAIDQVVRLIARGRS
jgi:D-alanyl-D-alanine carboxypeptidase/D-alanyl-D-alanine-endopeptidase (penicillin-binding protein 4)